MSNPSPNPDVAVLGAAALDWVVQVRELPQPDGITYAECYTPMAGGSGGNVAEALARLGHQVRFLGVLGDDENGRKLYQAFMNAGVDCSAVRIQTGESSASTFIAVDRRGERMIFSLGGTALYDKAEDIQPDWLEGTQVLFIADAFTEPALAAVQALPGSAKVVFNPGGLMVNCGLHTLQPILNCCEVFIASCLEARLLTGQVDPEASAIYLSQFGPRVVILTMGEQGALVREKGITQRVPAVRPEKIIDSTGAGDAFSAGVVSGMLKGLDWVQAARMGCAAASLKIAHFGARGGLPHSEQVDALLRTELEIR